MADFVPYTGPMVPLGAAAPPPPQAGGFVPYSGPMMALPPPEGGGVEDAGPVAPQAPLRGDIINPANMPQDTAAGYATTRIRNALTGAVATPRAMADLMKYGLGEVGAPPSVQTAAALANPLTAVSQFTPTAEEYNRLLEHVTGMKPVNTPGPAGKILDTGVEAAVGGLALPGGIRNVAPSFIGGAGSEALGQRFAGTPYEPFARLLGAIGSGTLAAAIQNAGGNVVQGIRNLLPNVDEATARLLARNLASDNMTLPQLEAARPPGGMLVEGAGPNVQGMLRGSVMPQGPAREVAQTNVGQRFEGSNARTTSALDQGLTPNDSLGMTTGEISAQRAAASGPAYRAAGVPDRPEMLEPARTVRTAINEPPTEIPAKWNTPSVNSPKLDALINDSADIKAAIADARRLPDFKDVPVNSMSMLDKVYKYLGDLEEGAKTNVGKETSQSRDIRNVRQDFLAALDEQNPRYTRALEAYSEPSKIIEAANRGREWFTKNVDPQIVAKEFKALTPDQQQAALVGARDWARTNIGRSERATAADRVRAEGENVDRLRAIMPPDKFTEMMQALDVEKNLNKVTNRTSLHGGSRTTPAALEAADNAGMSPFVDLLRGHPLRAAGKVVGGIYDRAAQGRTEAVNANAADLLTSMDPAKVGLVRALEAQQRDNLLRSGAGRQSAFYTGGVGVPTFNALTASGGQR